jgi:hypothetical protein
MNGDVLFEEKLVQLTLGVAVLTPYRIGDQMVDRDHFSAHRADQTWCLPTSVFWASQKYCAAGA